MVKKVMRKKKATKATKAVKAIVKKEIARSIEDKFVARQQAVFNLYCDAPTATGYMQLLNGLQLGTGVGNRLGNRVKCKYLELRIAIEGTPGIVALSTKFRAVVFRWNNCNASANPPVGQLLEAGAASIYNPIDCYNTNNVANKNIKVYRDIKKTCNLMNAPAALVQNEKHFITMKFPLNFITQYNNANAGTSTDILNNALFLYMTTDQLAAGNAAVITAYTWVLRYEDA